MTSALTNPLDRAPLIHQAVWNENNEAFRETFLEKVASIAFFLINFVASKLIVPASVFDQTGFLNAKDVAEDFKNSWNPQPDTEMSLLKRNYTPQSVEVTTPDGVVLRGTHFKHNAASGTAPTVIFFQPNAAISKLDHFDWLLEIAAHGQFRYNFISFDYRACGESEKASINQKKNLFLDGDSILQFVKDHLHVPAQDIHFYGWSLGGSVASNVKQAHPECTGRAVIERSLASINEIIKNMMPCFLAAIVGFFVWLINWNIDGVEPIEKLKGRTLIVHHPLDPIMKEQASLYQGLFERGAFQSPHIQELNLGQSPHEAPNFHCSPISQFRHGDFRPDERIAGFLFNSHAPLHRSPFERETPEFRNRVFTLIAQRFQNGGFYWGSGEDAFYNRNGQSLTSADRFWAIRQARAG